VVTNVISGNLIGKGGSSQVYRGCLPDGKELAVKILKPSDNVLSEFLLEIEIITTLHHKNIISLLGFCFENGKLLLVYDFLSRGSLEENLHGTQIHYYFFFSMRCGNCLFTSFYSMAKQVIRKIHLCLVGPRDIR